MDKPPKRNETVLSPSPSLKYSQYPNHRKAAGRDINGQAVSGVSAISCEDLTLGLTGAFLGSGYEQVRGYFYGTVHTEAGGVFNTETVAGAFGGTRQ